MVKFIPGSNDIPLGQITKQKTEQDTQSMKKSKTRNGGIKDVIKLGTIRNIRVGLFFYKEMSDNDCTSDHECWDRENEEQPINTTQLDGSGNIIAQFSTVIKHEIDGEDLLGYSRYVFLTKFASNKDKFGHPDATESHHHVLACFDTSE